jgi:hypothetical protein
MCWAINADTGIGYCIAFCAGSPVLPACPDASSCLITNNGVLPLCHPQCDPLTQDCISPQQNCMPSSFKELEGYICFDDASQGNAPYGSPCVEANSCNPGLLCVAATEVPETGCDATGCCSPMCSIAAALPCPGTGQSCEPVFVTQPAGYEDVGVCKVVP